MTSSVKEIRTGNRILSLLLHEEYKRLLPHLELVHLEKSEILYVAGENISHVYFPISGMISLLSTTGNGASIEVAVVGNEGMLGIPIILGVNRIPYEAVTQTTVDAYKIKGSLLREEFEHSEHLRKILLNYVNVLLAQISQSVVCSQFHTIQKRLCRWLLIARDVMKLDRLDLTQEIISHVLGIPRTGVTMAAVELQRAGLISYSRGHITILNQQELESASCECYRLVKDEFTGLRG